MNFATQSSRTRILVWCLWLLVFLTVWLASAQKGVPADPTISAGLLLHDERRGQLFPWMMRHSRWKKHALKRYRAWQQQYRGAKRAANWARLALLGTVPLARVVEWLTTRQVRYQLGALPVLYSVLETLKVRHIINRYCPTQGQVDHGTVALVLVLNRLMFPLPLYRIADWVGQTVLVAALGIPAEKFNDDRLERTLDALYPHLESIWTEIVTVALRKAGVDLSVIFYDLTAFVAHGRYAESELMDFGFAHNTPANKRKFKLGLNTVADGNLPGPFRLWSGRTADQATVQRNMENLARWLDRNGQPRHKTLVVGDRAMLNAEIALTYEQAGLRYLGGLRGRHDLLRVWDDARFAAFPIVDGPNPQYWGRGCTVSFTYEGRTVTHKGLVVLSGPLRDQLRQTREERLTALEADLAQVRAEIGQPRMRTLKAVQRRANARLHASPVGDLIKVTVYQTAAGNINLIWERNTARLAEKERLDGRYLLVTNDWSLSHRQMFQLYRDKDGGEKRFRISKGDLKVTPLYLHKDRRIASMMLLNMIALLAYSLLERQMRQQGLQCTTRHLIERLQNLTLIETHCRDGSIMRRLTDLTPEIQAILPLVAAALDSLVTQATASPPPLRLTEAPASGSLLLPAPD